MGGSPFVLRVDASEVAASAERMKHAFSRENFTRILHDTNVDVAKYTKTIVGQVASADYQVTNAWAQKHVGRWRSYGAYGAIIPLNGARGVIGKTFPMGASHVKGAKVKDKKTGKMRMDQRRRVKTATIKRGKASALPNVTPHQGGHPIFPLNGVAVTRTGSGGIARVVGRSLPHMIVNSPSRSRAEQQIERKLNERFYHHVERCLNGWA